MIDWSSPTYIASQVLATIVFVLCMSTYYMTDRRRQLITLITANAANASHFFLLHAFDGMAALMVSIARDLTSAITEKFRGKRKVENGARPPLDWFFLSLWIFLLAAIASITYKDPAHLVIYLSTMVFTVSIWQRNQMTYRVMGMVVRILNIIYGVLVGSVIFAASEFVMLIFVVHGTFIYIKNRP